MSAQEEADDRLMFHINFVVGNNGAKIVSIITNDTDIFVCLIHHFTKWKCNGLEELWYVKGKGVSRKVIPLHVVHSNLTPELVSILPAMHSLTGCDSTSKVGTRHAAMSCSGFFSSISSFGKEPLEMEMIEYAEHFLIHYVETKSTCTMFDELRCKSYFRYGLKADFSKVPCTSSSIQLQIKRAYLQCKR